VCEVDVRVAASCAAAVRANDMELWRGY